MTRKSASSTAPKRKKQELSDEFLKSHPFVYVNIKLSEDEKAIILDSVADLERIATWVMNMPFSLGYKIGIGYNFNDKCYIISATGIMYGQDDFNRCVTSRHSDFQVACTIAMYKHSQYCSEGIPAPEEKAEGKAVFD